MRSRIRGGGSRWRTSFKFAGSLAHRDPSTLSARRKKSSSGASKGFLQVFFPTLLPPTRLHARMYVETTSLLARSLARVTFVRLGTPSSGERGKSCGNYAKRRSDSRGRHTLVEAKFLLPRGRWSPRSRETPRFG